MGSRYVNFTSSLSVLIDFHLASIQSQLQMISPINDIHQYKEIIMSSEAKPTIFKPSVLIPVPEFNHVYNILASPSKLLNTFFTGKENKYVNNNSLNTKNSVQVLTTPIMEEPISTFSFNQTISFTTESTSILKVQNSTNTSFSTSVLNLSNYNESSTTDLENNHYTENSFDVTFISLASTIRNPILVKSNDNYEMMLLNGNDKFNINVLNNQGNTIPISSIITNQSKYIDHNITSSLLKLLNENKDHDINNYKYSISSNDSLVSKTVKATTIENITLNENLGKREKRSFELFFNSNVQVTKSPYIIVY